MARKYEAASRERRRFVFFGARSRDRAADVAGYFSAGLSPPAAASAGAGASADTPPIAAK